MKNLVILVSGNGTSVEKIYKNIENKILTKYKLTNIIYNKQKTNPFVLKRGKNWKVKFNEIDTKIENSLLDKLNEINKLTKIDHILCLGYTKLIPKNVIEIFKNKIINIHPTLLPKYGGKGMFGLTPHLEVLKNNEECTGPTIHKVNEEFDKGKILQNLSFKIPKEIRGISNEKNAKILQKLVLQKEHMLLNSFLLYLQKNN